MEWAGAALNMCIRAYDQGLLCGDITRTGISALSVAKSFELFLKRREGELVDRRIDGVIDAYIAIEHPDIYENVKQRREEESQTPTFDDLSADSMDEMLDMMRQMARMS